MKNDRPDWDKLTKTHLKDEDELETADWEERKKRKRPTA